MTVAPALARDGPGPGPEPAPEPVPRAAPEPERGAQLILEVRVNGLRSPLLWEFVQLPDGGLATSAERLRLLGFDLEAIAVAPDAALVPLAGIAGVEYHYSEPRQAVEIDAADAAMVPVVLDEASAPEPLDLDAIEENFGLVVNYGLYADASKEAVRSSGQYEVRLLSRFGVGEATGYATWVNRGEEHWEHVRLDTSWRYVDARRAIAFTAGDLIGDGGQFGTAYRLGGLQVRRDYGERADLVTNALPVFTASAAVPSTVDLYVNGLRYYTGEVGRGPFQFRSLPNLGGGATATVLLTDAAGRETRITRPIYFTPGLLAPGELDFSLEAGFPRFNYGTESFDYLGEPAASGSLRYGVTDWFTVLAHAEGMRGLANASLGATLRLGGIGSLTGGAAASRFGEILDIRWSVEAEARLAGIDFYAGIDRSNAGYEDVVTVSALRSGSVPPEAQPAGSVADPRAPILRAFSRQTERAGMSFSILRTGISLNYTRIKLPRLEVRPVSASVFRTIFGGVSVWANGYKDFGDRDDYGVYLGFSFTFGRGISASSTVSTTRQASTLSTRLSYDPAETIGTLGWSVTDNEVLSGPGRSLRAANVRYLARQATLGAGLEQYGGALRATGYAEGAMVAMGGVYFSPRIDSSFAVVRGAGAGTPVLSNTRAATRTNRSGRALVTNLASFDTNVVAIDPTNLPVDLKPARTQAVVVPGDRAGVIVDFGVAIAAEAIVILVDPEGRPLVLGGFVTLEGSAESAAIGYDGRVYLTGLAPHNRVRVQREGAPDCSAAFDFVPHAGQQVLIGPVTCQ